MQTTGATALVKSLIKEGVDQAFGIPGGAILPVYDALYKTDKLDVLLTRHEQGAIHAAQGYSYTAEKPGVCIVTSGPGATNLTTGLFDAMMDSELVVCICGQVPNHAIGSDAFQEADIMSITEPITKWNYQIQHAKEIPQAVAKAFQIARSGRPGPVLLDVTKTAQFEKAEFEYPDSISVSEHEQNKQPNQDQIKQAAEILDESEKPLMLIGHGVLIAEAQQEVKEVAEKSGIPIASTLWGLSAVPPSHDQYVGLLGMHGNYAPNKLTNEADVILAVGMRFDDRVTGKLEDYANQADVIHIDIDPAELNKNVEAKVPIAADAKPALSELHQQLEENSHPEWMEEFDRLYQQEKEKIIDGEINPESGPIKMGEAVHELSEQTNGEAIIVPDVGKHQMDAARYYDFNEPHSLITSGGSGTMGIALPAGLGAKVATDREVVAIVGDGSLQMTMQELSTLAKDCVPLKVMVMNNDYYGIVRQWQELFFEENYCCVGLENPDFVGIAQNSGVHASRVMKRENLTDEINKMLEHKGPYLLDIVVEEEENVFPMIPAGAAVDEMLLEENDVD